MTKAIYSLVCMIFAPILLIVAIGGIFTTVYRGEVIQGLQAEIIKNTKQDVKVVIEKVEAVNQVGSEYAETQTKILNDQKVVTREYTKIIEVPIFNNECISSDGVLKYNETFARYSAKTDPSSEPNAGMQ